MQKQLTNCVLLDVVFSYNQNFLLFHLTLQEVTTSISNIHNFFCTKYIRGINYFAFLDIMSSVYFDSSQSLQNIIRYLYESVCVHVYI